MTDAAYCECECENQRANNKFGPIGNEWNVSHYLFKPCFHFQNPFLKLFFLGDIAVLFSEIIQRITSKVKENQGILAIMFLLVYILITIIEFEINSVIIIMKYFIKMGE